MRLAIGIALVLVGAGAFALVAHMMVDILPYKKYKR